jgi:hypothetical protein
MNLRDLYNILLLDKRVVPFDLEKHVVREEVEMPGDPVYDKVGRVVGQLIKKPKNNYLR